MASATALIFMVLALTFAEQVSSLNVTVYYESLCPDSIRFITRQLYPTYQQLEFDVIFKPYGKAQHNVDPWQIRCQHGPNECLGNAVQACLLARVTKPDDQVELVNCIMSSGYPPLAGGDCTASLGLDYDGVSDCSTSDEGRQLLAGLGDETHSLIPPLTFVPTVIINNQFDQDTQNLALTNLPSAICSRDPSVVGCSKLKRRF